MTDDPASYLVAHRGDQEQASENSLAAFEAAVNSGARYLECDIQFTRDFTAVVSHDNRIGGATISQLKASALPRSELKLESLLAWLKGCEGVTLFLEIKSPVLRRKSATAVANLVFEMIPESLKPRIIPIAISAKMVAAFAPCFGSRIGWVAEGQKQPETRFDYIFLPEKRISEACSWRGQGVITAIYTINNAGYASALYASDIDLVETNYFCRLSRELKSH